MPDDTEAAALRARLEAIVKKVEDAEAQAAAARRRVQATRLLLEEESKAAALEHSSGVHWLRGGLKPTAFLTQGHNVCARRAT
jgi:hypothetical protein